MEPSRAGTRRQIRRKHLPPPLNQVLVWSYSLAFPLLVAAGWYFIQEPHPDPTSLTTWLAAGCWMAIGAAVISTANRSRRAVEQKFDDRILLAIMVAVLALASSSLAGVAAAANVLIAGSWGLFVGIAVPSVYLLGYRRKLLYCEVCVDYSWMTRTTAGFRCYYCKTLWIPGPAGSKSLVPARAASPETTVPSTRVVPPTGIPRVDILERKRMKAAIRVSVPTSPRHVIEAAFQTTITSSAQVVVDGKPFQKVRILMGGKTIQVALSPDATVALRFWLGRVPQIDVGFNGIFVKRV